MSKLIGSACLFVFLLFVGTPQNERFSKYKAIEAYEVRPGVLIMPRYSEDGQVCEIGIEKRHYSPEEIFLDASLSRKEIDQITDELAPANVRGPKKKGVFGGDLISEIGRGLTTKSEYENVSITIYSSVSPTSKKGEIVADDIAATIKWTNRKCQ